MNILAVIGKDTSNFTMEYIIRTMQARGHKVDIFGKYTSENHLYMFGNDGMKVNDLKELSVSKADTYDAAFIYTCFFVDYPEYMESKTFFYAYDSLYYDEPVLGADCMFERGAGWRKPLKAGSRSECTYIVTGDPKHDTVNVEGISENPKKFLFIDSGHYPFGMEGKREAAKVLIDICRKFPDYELIVKPRFIKGDKNVTHRNLIYLYDVILELVGGKIPQNMILLQEHKNLDRLIAGAHTVICMYTTAYMDAAIQGKNLLILDNLPNEDNVELRVSTHWNPAREIMEESGCLVDYREAVSYLPEGLKCREEHLKKHIYSVGNASVHIVSAMEQLHEKYLKKGKYPPAGTFFCDKMDEMDERESLSFMEVTCNRKQNYLFLYERGFYKNTGFFPDDGGISDFIRNMKKEGKLTEYTVPEIIRCAARELIKYTGDIRQDEISQSFLLMQIVYSGMTDKIYEIQKDKIYCKQFYHYILGRAEYANGRYLEAAESFEVFLEKREGSAGNDVKEVADLEEYKVSAYYYCGVSYKEIKEYEKAEYCFKKCQELTAGQHRKAAEELQKLR